MTFRCQNCNAHLEALSELIALDIGWRKVGDHWLCPDCRGVDVPPIRHEDGGVWLDPANPPEGVQCRRIGNTVIAINCDDEPHTTVLYEDNSNEEPHTTVLYEDSSDEEPHTTVEGDF